MRLLGIDYGTKRIGIAMTDEGGNMAFPKATLANDRHFFGSLKELVEGGRVEKIIIGESLKKDGTHNEIMQKIQELARKIDRELNLPVEYETEVYSSEAAKRLQGDAFDDNNLLDASAAALVLNSYIDRYKRDNKKL
ncbi:MAG: Holliday junction resolvase RuvX [Candidatus Paceibacterota bacterium]